MSKETFIDTLQYGPCPGTPYTLDKCFWDNAGAKFDACPDSVKVDIGPCNCCERCRKECARANAIREINRRNIMDDLDALEKYLDEEI